MPVHTVPATSPDGPTAAVDPADDLLGDVRAGGAHRQRSTSARASRTGTARLGAVEAAVDALRTGRNQYPPGPGYPELREAVAAHQPRHYGIELDPATEVVVTAGATEALAAAIFALVDPGDEMVVLEPFYDSYVACIEMAGGVRRPVTLRAPDFRLDVDALRAAVTPRTTTILLNTPHNPTGAVLTRAELEAVAAGRGRARPGGGDRRGLRAPALRRARARPDLHAARHVGADGDASPAPARPSPSPAGRSAGSPGRPSWWRP